MKKSLDQFTREFLDELVGIACRERGQGTDSAVGFFIRERENKCKTLIARMYASLDDTLEPKTPSTNGAANGQQKPANGIPIPSR